MGATSTFRRQLSLLARLAAGVAPLAACNQPIKWNVTTLGSVSGTVGQIHGRTDVATLPANCLATSVPFPDKPEEAWNKYSPSVRTTGALVGYRSWHMGTGVPAVCGTNQFTTQVYRGLFRVDLTSFAGKGGTIAKAEVIATAVAVPGMPANVPTTGPNALLCDAQAGAAFQVVQVPPAVQLPNGLAVTVLNTPALEAAPPIPSGLPSGTTILNFPTKNPALAASLGQPQYRGDATQQVVGALNGGATSITFMITGTNEPPSLKTAPLPVDDCLAMYKLDLAVSTP